MNTPARVIDLDDSHEVDVSIEQMGVSAAEVLQQISTAKKFPRSLQKFRQQLISQVTLSEQIAQSCLYALPRGGKKIEGPSIRFAEIAMGCWGNCRATARIVAETENFIVAQGIFIDLERNVAVGIEVNRRIVDSKGRRFDIDMIGVTGSAASSIALRNAILRGIPRALFEEGYIAAKRTVAGTLATLADRRNRALEAFKPYGVTEGQILEALGKQGLVEIGLEELVTLGGYLTAIQQEERDPEDIFPAARKAGERQAAPVQQQKPAPAASAGAAASPKGARGPVSDAGGAGSEPPAKKSTSPSGGESAGADVRAADGAQEAKGQASPADTSSTGDDAKPTQLEDSIASALFDCVTLSDVASVEQMFAEDIAKVGADEQARIERQFNDVREAMTQPVDDDFPGDR